MSVHADPRVGSVLAGYRIERLLGRGGMGVVYLAHDLRLDRNVALKLLSPELADEHGFRERFLRESRLAASLDHENVIPIYEAGEADGQLFIAMRYVEGTDLATLLRETGPLEPARAIAILEQVASALDTAHERGLVHRDVKPSNILLARNEHAYLADFGLTRSLDSPGLTAEYASSLGTVDYVAPEQIDGDPPDPRADQYSLACVAYETLTGQPPFHADTSMGVLWNHLQSDPPSAHQIRPEFPDRIDTVLAHALAKGPGDRYETCTELIADARNALGLHPAPRRRLALLAAVLAAAAVVLVAVLLATGGDGKSEPSTTPTLAPEVDALQRIDPETDQLVATIRGPEGPSGLSAGQGAVWVSNAEGGMLLRVDPETNREAGSVPIGPGARNVLAAGGAVWVVEESYDLIRLEPDTGRVLTRLSPGALQQLAYGDENLFGTIPCTCGIGEAVGQPGVVRIPYKLDAAAPTFDRLEVLSLQPKDIAVGGGSVWVTHDQVVVFELLRFSTSSFSEVAARIPLEGGAIGVAYGEDSVWVANVYEDTVSRIDPARNLVVSRIAVGDTPVEVAVGNGSVWVVNHADGTVSRIDPETEEVVATIPVGPRPDHIAVGDDGVWVTVDAE